MKGTRYLAPMAMLAGLCSMTWAQEEPHPPKGNPTDQIVTGCLDKGNVAGEYVLTDEKSGNKITVISSASADLTPHAAKHKVKLTGTVERAGGRSVFKADNVEHIAATCSSPAKD